MNSSRTAGLLLLTAGIVFAQSNTTALRFEVASVIPSKPGRGPHGTPLVTNPGRVTLNDATLRQIIGHAYNVRRVRVLNCPSWSDSKGFDVIAKAENPNATQDQIRRMLQTLLLERFKLAAHREKRVMQAYVLAVGKNGPGQLVSKKAPMSSLAALLANILDTPVEDTTGFKGLVDFTLRVGDGVAPGVNDPRKTLPDAVEKLGLQAGIQEDAG
jgi:hypothetical protein